MYEAKEMNWLADQEAAEWAAAHEDDWEEVDPEDEEEDWDEEPSDWDLEMGFDPYEGGYTWDC